MNRALKKRECSPPKQDESSKQIVQPSVLACSSRRYMCLVGGPPVQPPTHLMWGSYCVWFLHILCWHLYLIKGLVGIDLRPSVFCLLNFSQSIFDNMGQKQLATSRTLAAQEKGRH
jgi:hypothetical protein